MIQTRTGSINRSTEIEKDEIPTIYMPEPRPTTMEEPSGFRKMYLATAAALINGIGMGLVLGYSSPAIPSMERPLSSFHLEKNEESWFGSLMAIGALFGGLAGGPFTNYLGRKRSLCLCSMLFTLGWITIGYTKNIGMLYFSRIVTGFSSGLVSITAPMYVIEISTAEVRGLLGSSFQLSVVFGVFLAMLTGYYLPWSWLAITCAMISVISLMAILPMPKSPRWLMMKDMKLEALISIKFLQDGHVDPRKECENIEEDILSQPKGNISWKEFLDPCVWKPTLLSFALMYFQQFSGVNGIMFYVSTIFSSAGSSKLGDLSSVIVAAVQVVATLVGCLLMDRAGRKILLLACGIGTSISLFMMGLYFYLKELNGESFEAKYSWLTLFSLVIFISSFSIGLGPIPWLMVAEMLPQRVRSLISAVATGLNWTFVFIITSTFSAMETAFHPYGTYWFYTANCVLCVFFSWFVLPETKGKKLEEIQKMFTGRNKKRNSSLLEELITQ